MLLLAAWSTNGWLPSGHAMRMALDLGLHRALEKLADDSGKQRTEEEERDLGGSFTLRLAQTALKPVKNSCFCSYLALPVLVRSPVRLLSSSSSTFSNSSTLYRMSLGTGRPIILRDESSIKHCRVLLHHPMASQTDVRLISQVELIAQKSKSGSYPTDFVRFLTLADF